jgi:hypothetical protein
MPKETGGHLREAGVNLVASPLVKLVCNAKYAEGCAGNLPSRDNPNPGPVVGCPDFPGVYSYPRQTCLGVLPIE